MSASDEPPVDSDANTNAEADRPDEREASLRCWRCSFDLHEFRTAANCPGCGSPVEISLTRPGRLHGRPRQIDDGVLCGRCGTSLGGVDEDAACGACGLDARVTLLAVAHTLPIDDAGILVGNVGCRSCGYNLRSQHRSGRCPECGVDVESSLRQDLLAFANPKWLRRVALGCKLVAIGLAMFLAGSVLVFAFVLSISLGVVRGLVWIAGCVTVYAGFWLVAAIEPGALGQYRLSSRRSIARGALILVPVCWFLFLVLAANSMGNSYDYLLGALTLLSGTGAVLGVVGYFGHLADIVLRVPSKALSKTCKNLSIALGCLAGIPHGSLLIVMVLEFAGVSTEFTLLTIFGSIMVGVGVGLLLSIIIVTFVHWRIAALIGKQVRASEMRWS